MKILFWASSILILPLLCGCVMQEASPADMVSTTQSQPASGEQQLTAELSVDIGSLEIGSDKSANIYNLDMEYDRAHYEPDVRYDKSGGDGRLTVKLEGTHKFGVRNERRTNRVRLMLSESVPLQLNIHTGVGDARLSLSDLQLTELDLESGVGGARISAYDPNPVTCERIRLRNGVGSLDAVGLGNLNFRRLDFEGGVGGASLDLTGDWKQDASMRIEVGVGGVSLKMPRDIGVRVEAEKHFLSGLHLDGFEKRDGEYYSENYDSARIRVSIRVQTGVGGFRITWI
jgi:hypothetical protein